MLPGYTIVAQADGSQGEFVERPESRCPEPFEQLDLLLSFKLIMPSCPMDDEESCEDCLTSLYGSDAEVFLRSH